MKKTYHHPKIVVVKVKPRTTMLAGSPTWNEDEQTGIDPTPGSQESFGVKDDDGFFGW